MQNKCNCQDTGFVPVSGNWDFGMNGDCGCNDSRGYDNRSTRRNSGGKHCGACETGCTRNSNPRGSGRSGSDCQCERCDDSRTAECCDRNTYIRDVDDCECGYTNENRARTSCGCDECTQCSGNDRNRSEGCGCDEQTAYTRPRCGCESNAGAYARSGKNRGVGMVKGYMQEIDEIFQSESALRAGTLFPELHKPLNGYCPYDGNCGTCAQAAAFAAWELRLYLNTHPNDEEALKLFRKLCKEAEGENYATTFLTDECCADSWSWVKNPWPWEYDCHCGE